MILRKLSLLPKKKLQFYIVECNVPKPFEVKWKVRNVGEEAIRINQINRALACFYKNSK